jgi:hypothetical protein
MFFAFKKYTILHSQTDTNYGLLKINHFFFAQSDPHRLGCGSGMDLPW